MNEKAILFESNSEKSEKFLKIGLLNILNSDKFTTGKAFIQSFYISIWKFQVPEIFEQ